MLQWNPYEPAVVGAVNVAVDPGLMSPVFHSPLSAVFVCVVESMFSTVTVAPGFTVIDVNLKFWIVIVSPAPADFVAAAAGVLDDEFLLLLLPHAATPMASMATAMRIRMRRCMPVIRSDAGLSSTDRR
jgi:hypothetical protein